MPRPRALLLLGLATAALALASAPASAALQIGISDQTPHMFDNRYFKRLGVKTARIVVPWNILKRRDYWPGYLQAWLNGAAANGVEPHVAFNIINVEEKYFGKGPTPRQYRTLIRGFRKRYPVVRTFTPWNEANHIFQPTARRPKLAFKYYRILRRVCPGCKILAADVLDDANLPSWIARFRRHYDGRATWGLHNYQDANHRRPFRESFTYQMTKLVKGDIWSTEAGGMVGFKTVKGRIAYRYSVKRQLKSQRHLFRLMSHRKVRHRYKRVYIYHWFGTWNVKGKKTNRWDSGLLGLNGVPRPAYYDLKRRIAKSR